MWKKRTSENYEFYFKEGSTAERHIDNIMSEQEACFERITKELDVKMKEKLVYKLLESPQEVGVCYGDNEPCNGFTRMPNEIYAVYCDDVKCIGFHEDAHMISYMTINRPNYNFIREGLAMHFDEKWQGISNDLWVKYYLDKKQLPKISSLLNNNQFHKVGEMITYPLSGAFTSFLIKKFGMKKYKSFYKNIDSYITYTIRLHFKGTVEVLEKEFLEYIKSLKISTQSIKHIKKQLN